MKILILIPAMVLFLISCNSNQTKLAAEKRIADSIQQVKMLEREKFLADSLEKAQRLELVMNAFGGIKFGMSRDTVMAIMKKTLNQGREKTLGAYNYSFTPKFTDEGLLYILQLQTASESSLQLESSVRAKVDNLKQIITAKYGEPQKSYGYPDDFAFVETQTQWIHIWEIDTKTIKIGVLAETEGSRYKAVCSIQYDPLLVKQLNKGNDLLESKIEKAASDL